MYVHSPLAPLASLLADGAFPLVTDCVRCLHAASPLLAPLAAPPRPLSPSGCRWNISSALLKVGAREAYSPPSLSQLGCTSTCQRALTVPAYRCAVQAGASFCDTPASSRSVRFAAWRSRLDEVMANHRGNNAFIVYHSTYHAACERVLQANSHMHMHQRICRCRLR